MRNSNPLGAAIILSFVMCYIYVLLWRLFS